MGQETESVAQFLRKEANYQEIGIPSHMIQLGIQRERHEKNWLVFNKNCLIAKRKQKKKKKFLVVK